MLGTLLCAGDFVQVSDAEGREIVSGTLTYTRGNWVGVLEEQTGEVGSYLQHWVRRSTLAKDADNFYGELT